MVRSLLELVAPTRCAGCGVRAPLPWCVDCRDAARALRRVGGCPRCAGVCRPSASTCAVAGTGVAATHAAFTYTGIVARTVVAAKVGGHHGAWRPLGRLLGDLLAAAPPPVDVVVPVATEPGRARRRGFDHAVLLAGEVAGRLGRPCRRALRTRARTPDRGRGHHAVELPVGAIRARQALTGARVLLVDDVLTTGATVRAAAAAAAGAGAVHVEVAVLARAGR